MADSEPLAESDKDGAPLIDIKKLGVIRSQYHATFTPHQSPARELLRTFRFETPTFKEMHAWVELALAANALSVSLKWRMDKFDICVNKEVLIETYFHP